jgi:hypothetical protein
MSNVARRDFEIYARGIKRLEELEKEIDFLNVDKKFPSEVASIRSKLKHVSEIPQIEMELKSLKNKIAGKTKKHARRTNVSDEKIKALKQEISRKASQCKKLAPLSKDVLKLKLEIHGLQNKVKTYEDEEKRRKRLLGNINVGVERVFDNTMDMSLNDIKAKLSKEVENKEAAVQRELQEDLRRREELFNERYSELEKDFHKKYNEKVSQELKKEVQSRLDSLVKNEVDKKKKLSDQELVSLRRKLLSEFHSKENALQKHFDEGLSVEKDAQREQFRERLLAEKVKLHKKLDSELAKEVVMIKQNQAQKTHELSNKIRSFANLKEKLSDVFRKNEQVEEEKIARQEEALKKKGEKLSEEFRSKEQEEEKKIARQEEALNRKGDKIKEKLQLEFEEKLREAIKQKEKELIAKNLQLEKEIRNKVKSFYH